MSKSHCELAPPKVLNHIFNFHSLKLLLPFMLEQNPECQLHGCDLLISFPLLYHFIRYLKCLVLQIRIVLVHLNQFFLNYYSLNVN